MKSKYVITILSFVALAAILFFFGNTVKKTTGQATAEVTEDDHTHQVAPADFDSLLAAAKKKLSPQEQAAVAKEENSVTRGDVKQQQIDAYENLGKLWMKRNRHIAAYYFGQSGKLENSEKKLNFAAHLLTEELADPQQEAGTARWMTDQAIAYYKQALEINPDNDTAKIDLALLYVNRTPETMNGIQLLLGVVEKDPSNIPANVVLGRMAVESGQLDKAIERGQKVLSVDSKNLEAYLFLGEAYKRNGEIDKAVEMFEAAKSLMDNPEFHKDIDDYIQSFK